MPQPIMQRIGHTTRRSVRKENAIRGPRIDGNERTKVRMKLRKTAARPWVKPLPKTSWKLRGGCSNI